MSKRKCQYRIRTWRSYHAALVRRGSLTVWFDEAYVERWYETPRSGRRGAPRRYAAIAVQGGLVMREVFPLPLRATEGLMRSVIGRRGVALTTPDDSTFSRRAAPLPVLIGRGARGRARPVVIDSPGLPVYGEGEWKVRQHGVSRRRTWRQLHLAVDAGTHEGIAAALTAAGGDAAEVLPDLLTPRPAEEPLACVAADGADDPHPGHPALRDRQAAARIPPRAGAVAWPPLTEGQPHPRTTLLDYVRQPGLKAGQTHGGYHRRSLAETAMFRLTTLVGGRLKNHRFDTQATEAYARRAALNTMTRLGMPETVVVF